jgi:asparagine synthase (glutamine-hydrolysing)
MCGIAGFIDAGTPPEARHQSVEKMCAVMVHRGPDDAGVETRGPATIGMRRLAIFDPRNGHQPMITADGRFQIVFNGAIYNFRTLREELSREGFPFKTECDTEVLLAAYAHWGEDCLRRLRGMFAFAIWDSRDEILFLARDPFGIKPLYYYHNSERLLFASELRALLAAGIVKTEIDPHSVADYLGWLAVPAPRTIYRSISSLKPGECATFRRGKLEKRDAWSFHGIDQSIPVCQSREEFVEELRGRLDDTIRAHVVADVPVGAFLSGGLDSAAVAALMTRTTGARLKTFTIGFDEAGYDEASAAESTARFLGTDHFTRVLTGAEVARDLPTLLASYDQPTGDGINTYYASQTARAGGVTVALSGLGGDELLGGYPSFNDIPYILRWLPYWTAMPRALRRPVLSGLRQRGARYLKLADMLENARNINELCALQRRVFPESKRLKMLSGDVRSTLRGSPPHHPGLGALASDLAAAGIFETISAWELRTYMADVLLRDSDVMSMRHSLELRVPFVDRPLIEWLWRQPSRFKADRAQPKSALAAAVRDLLPPEMASRQKRGFSLPFASWMQAELRPFLDHTFSTSSVEKSGLFTCSAVQQFWGNYLKQNDRRQWSRVWSLAVLIDFANRAGQSRAPVPAQRISLSITPDSRPFCPSPSRRNAATPRKTLLLAPEIFASEGGIPRILQIYLKALCELGSVGDSVRLVALNDDQIDPTAIARTSNHLLTDVRGCHRSKVQFVRHALALSRGCQRVICGHIGQLPVALAAKTINPRLKYYLVAHGIEVWRPFTVIERLALKGAEKILCVSDYTRRVLLSHCPLPEGRAVVLHNALDPSFEIAPGRPRNADRPVILTITRLTLADRYKGVEHLIEAMPAIRAKIPGAVLKVIGRGDDMLRLQHLRDALGQTTAIEFLGYVDDARMKAELRACNVFALPSKKEGFGLVFLEAMANGRPCMGARAGGIPEVITPETGALVEFGDVPALAEACVAALQRDWDEATILERARAFSYSPFKHKLASLLKD